MMEFINIKVVNGCSTCRTDSQPGTSVYTVVQYGTFCEAGSGTGRGEE